MSELNERLGYAVRDGKRFVINGTFVDANPVRVSDPALGWPSLPQGRTVDVGVKYRVYNPSTTNFIAQTDVDVVTSALGVTAPGAAPTMNATPGNAACGELIGPGGDMYQAYAGPYNRDLWICGTAGQSWQVSGNLMA